MADLSKPRIIVICGPTATGKTALSVALAKQYNGEIISADSMQIYRGLDVGTAKVTPEETEGVMHHLVDFLPPEQTFSVADFTERAQRCIAEITGRGRLPFLVGGTGLYIQSLVRGVRFAQEKADPALRLALQRELAEQGPRAMYEQLCRVDPESGRAIHPNNTVRVLRALEHYRSAGTTLTQQKKESLPPEPPYRALCFALNPPDRQLLYQKTDLRVERMMEAGLLEEARRVWEHREDYKTAAQAIGYKEFFGYFEGTEPLEHCVDKLKQATRNYAKRQLTWFGRMEEMHWLDPTDPQLIPEAEQEIEEFLKA